MYVEPQLTGCSDYAAFDPKVLTNAHSLAWRIYMMKRLDLASDSAGVRHQFYITFHQILFSSP